MRRALLVMLASLLAIGTGCHAHSTGMVLNGVGQWVGQNQEAKRTGYGTPDRAGDRYWSQTP